MSNIAKIEKETAEQARKAIIANIVILPELQRYIPPLDGDTLQQLEQNILAEGVRDSIILWQTTYDNVKAYPQKINNFYRENCYVVVDGHNRYGICQNHNIEFPFIVMDFESLDAVKAFMVKLQLGRRNLTKEQISYFRGLEYTAAKKQHGGVREEKASNQNEYLLENKKTIEVLAEKHNTSPANIQRDEAYAKGLGFLTEDFRNQVLSGKTKIDKATIQNLPKVYAKAPNARKIENIDDLNHVYKVFREMEAEKAKAAAPITSPLPPPKGEKTATSGISKFQNLPKREEKVVGLGSISVDCGEPDELFKDITDSESEGSEEIKALKEKLNFLTAKLEQQKDYDDLKIQVGYAKEQQSITFDQKVKFMERCEELEREMSDLRVKLMKSEAKVRELETANKNLQTDLDFQNHFIENWNREEEVAKLKSKIEVLLNENEEVCNKANRLYEENEKLKDDKEHWYSIAEKNSANYIKLQNEIKQQQAKKGK